MFVVYVYNRNSGWQARHGNLFAIRFPFSGSYSAVHWAPNESSRRHAGRPLNKFSQISDKRKMISLLIIRPSQEWSRWQGL